MINFDDEWRNQLLYATSILDIRISTAICWYSREGYDSEDKHVLVRDELHAISVIPARYEHVPMRKTYGRYRKQMKRGYSKLLHRQRNKNEVCISYLCPLDKKEISFNLYSFL